MVASSGLDRAITSHLMDRYKVALDERLLSQED